MQAIHMTVVAAVILFAADVTLISRSVAETERNVIAASIWDYVISVDAVAARDCRGRYG